MLLATVTCCTATTQVERDNLHPGIASHLPSQETQKRERERGRVRTNKVKRRDQVAHLDHGKHKTHAHTVTSVKEKEEEEDKRKKKKKGYIRLAYLSVAPVLCDGCRRFRRWWTGHPRDGHVARSTGAAART